MGSRRLARASPFLIGSRRRARSCARDSRRVRSLYGNQMNRRLIPGINEEKGLRKLSCIFILSFILSVGEGIGAGHGALAMVVSVGQGRSSSSGIPSARKRASSRSRASLGVGGLWLGRSSSSRSWGAVGVRQLFGLECGRRSIGRLLWGSRSAGCRSVFGADGDLVVVARLGIANGSRGKGASGLYGRNGYLASRRTLGRAGMGIVASMSARSGSRTAWKRLAGSRWPTWRLQTSYRWESRQWAVCRPGSSGSRSSSCCARRTARRIGRQEWARETRAARVEAARGATAMDTSCRSPRCWNANSAPLEHDCGGERHN
jgi:hypothetical protein